MELRWTSGNLRPRTTSKLLRKKPLSTVKKCSTSKKMSSPTQTRRKRTMTRMVRRERLAPAVANYWKQEPKRSSMTTNPIVLPLSCRPSTWRRRAIRRGNQRRALKYSPKRPSSNKINCKVSERSSPMTSHKAVLAWTGKCRCLTFMI